MSSIKCVIQERFGRPNEVLKLREHTLDAPADGHVQVEVDAAPVLPMDKLRIRGLYPLAQEVPGVPGAVGVGRVVQGPDDWLGRTVCVPMRAGSWAQRINVPIEQSLRLDGDPDPLQTSLLRVNGLTAQALLDGVPARDWVLLNAANGGVGRYVVQVAERMRINVAALVRRSEAVPQVSAKVVLVDGPDLRERLKDAGVGNVHRALDGVGGEATARLGAAIADGGRVLHYGASSRQSPTLGVADTIFRGVLLQGFWLYRLDSLRGPAETERLLNRMVELGFTAPVHHELALEEVHAAFELSGRVVLRPQSASSLPTA